MNNAQILPESRQKRSSLAMMLVLVACLAVIFWRWRDFSGSHAAFKLARTIDAGSSSARARAMNDLYLVSADQAWAAMPSLFAALDDPDPQVRTRATAGLFYLVHEGDHADEMEEIRKRLFVAAKNSDPMVRAWAIDLLNSAKFSPPTAKPPADVIELVNQAVLDPDGLVRERAYAHLEKRAGTDRELERLMFDAASDDAPQVRAFAIRRLNQQTYLSARACLVVIRALNDPTAEVRTAVTSRYLVIPANVSVEALPDLIQAFRAWKPGPYEPTNLQSHNRWSVRSRILSILQSLGPAASSAIPALVEQLPGNEAVPQDLADYEIISTLGAIAPGSAEAKAWVPSLVAILTGRQPCPDRDRSFALSAAGSFLWDPEIIAALREVADDDNRANDSSTARYFLKSQPKPPEIIQP